MAANQSDRSLRLMVARLRKLRPDDFESVIDRLDSNQRCRVLSLVAELDGESVLPPDDDPELALSHQIVIPDQISGWLAARANGCADSGEETADPFRLAPYAQAALRRCAAAMVPSPVVIAKPSSLFDRLWSKWA